MQRRIVIAGAASIRRALAAAGFAVVADSGDAREAVADVARERPDVCLLDADLPGGALVATAAIARPVQPPAVVVVGDGSERQARAAALAGADAYLRRDTDGDRLIDIVAALLRRPKRRGN